MVDSPTSFHHVRLGVSHLSNNNYCGNAAPCRWLAWDKESVKSEKLYQPHRTRPDHNKNRETVNLDRCHQTGPVPKPFGDLPPTRGVGYLNRFQGRLLPYTYTGTIQEIPEISHSKLGIPFQGPAFVCPQHPWSSL